MARFRIKFKRPHFSNEGVQGFVGLMMVAALLVAIMQEKDRRAAYRAMKAQQTISSE